MLNRRRIPILRQAARLFVERRNLRNLVFPDLDRSGGRLRMRSLQLWLHLLWDQMDDSTLIPWDQECRLDLEWWVTLDRLPSGISLAQVNPHLNFWSDASDMGWGAHLQDVTASGLWSPEEAFLSINARELLAIPTPCVELYGGGLCGQFRSSVLPPQTRGHSISTPQLDCAEDPPLGRVDRLDLGASVYPRQEQCSSGLLVSSESSPGIGVDSEVAGISGAEPQVTSDDRSFCHLVESPLFTLFFALPRSVADRYGCTSSELGRVSGVCLSTLVNDTSGSDEAPIILWGPHDSCCSPETMVSGPSGTSGRRSNRSTSVP